MPPALKKQPTSNLASGRRGSTRRASFTPALPQDAPVRRGSNAGVMKPVRRTSEEIDGAPSLPAFGSAAHWALMHKAHEDATKSDGPSPEAPPCNIPLPAEHVAPLVDLFTELRLSEARVIAPASRLAAQTLLALLKETKAHQF